MSLMGAFNKTNDFAYTFGGIQKAVIEPKMPRLCKGKSDHPFADRGVGYGKNKTRTLILFLRGSFPVEVDISFQKTVLAVVCGRV